MSCLEHVPWEEEKKQMGEKMYEYKEEGRHNNNDLFCLALD